MRLTIKKNFNSDIHTDTVNNNLLIHKLESIKMCMQASQVVVEM